MSKYPVNKNQLSDGKSDFFPGNDSHFDLITFLEKKPKESALQKLLQKQTQKQSQQNVPDEEQLNNKGTKIV